MKSFVNGIKRFPLIVAAGLFLLSAIQLRAGVNKPVQEFAPICKYLSIGDAESLSAWFSSDLDVSILGFYCEASRNKARQMMKSFFEEYTPRSFEVVHTAGRPDMKYFVGNLDAGGETFHVTMFVSSKGSSFEIQQLKIDRR